MKYMYVSVPMVNINHPCYEVHVWVVDNQSDYETAKAQGYESIVTLRKNHAQGCFHDPEKIEDLEE